MTSSSAGHRGPPDTDDTAALPTTRDTQHEAASSTIAPALDPSPMAKSQPDQADSALTSTAPTSIESDKLRDGGDAAASSTNPTVVGSLTTEHHDDQQQNAGNVNGNHQIQEPTRDLKVEAVSGGEDAIMTDAPAGASAAKQEDGETVLHTDHAGLQQADVSKSQNQPGTTQSNDPRYTNPGGNTESSAENPATQPPPEQHTPSAAPATLAIPAGPTDVSVPPATPFTPVGMSNLDTHAYYMMALAMSQNQPAMSPPPTVTPSQVTLPPPDAQDKDVLPYPNGYSRQGGDVYKLDEKLESFARLEFQDSVFQITTYAVIIGRDQQALEQARRDERRHQEYQRKVKEAEKLGHPPPSPPNHKNRPKFSKSYVSEEGGMLGPASDNSDDAPPAKRRKTSVVGSEHPEEEASGEVVSDRQYVSHTPGAAAVDLEALRPSQDHVPFIGIHSPGPNIATKTKAISREHLKIGFNREKGVFEARPMHKNGFFCQDVHYKDPSQPVTLRNGDRLQIKDVGFKFVIPGVARGLTGAEPTSNEGPIRKRGGGKEMSFDFDDSREMRETSEEPLSELDESMSEISNLGQDFQTAEPKAVAQEPPASLPQHSPMDEGSSISNGQHDMLMHDSLPMDAEGMMFQLPRKRGPGRPPKNGIMSKREQRLLKKQQQEMARKTLPEVPPPSAAMEPQLKRKVGRPRKNPGPEDGSLPEKRKYKPRKPREEGGEGSDAERRAKERKDKKVRPKSPPLELRIEDFTEEQLQKPNKNYGVLIDETLTAAPDGLTLKQIYKRICQRYPWFFFHTETKGWESSVRHNLIGNDAFKKDDNLWFRVPGVELDAGKKRKPTSPDRGHQTHGYGQYAYGYGAPHMAAHGMPQGQAPPGYPVPGYNGQPPPPPPPVRPGHAGPAGSPPSQPNQPAQIQPNTVPPQPPGYGHQPPAQGQYGAPQGSYSSPYAQRPPLASASPSMKTEEGSVPLQHVPPGQPQVPQAGPMAHAPPTGHPAQGVAQPQGPRQTSGTPGRISETPQPPKPVIDAPLLSAVVNLRQGLTSSLQKARNPLSDDIVFSAMSRCLGFKTTASGNEKMEGICIKGITQVMDGYLKNKPTPAAPGNPPPGPSPNATDFAEAAKLWNEAPKIMDFQPFHRLLGFKKVTIQSLTPALGFEMAESIALSAINRALGFFETSIPAAKKPKDPKGNEIRVAQVETNLIRSIRQMLLAHGYTIPNTTTGQ